MLKKRKWPLKGWHKVGMVAFCLLEKHFDSAAARMLNSLLSSKTLLLKRSSHFHAPCFTLFGPLSKAHWIFPLKSPPSAPA